MAHLIEWRGRGREAYLRIIEEVLECKLDAPLCVRCCNGMGVCPQDDDAWHLLLWSAPHRSAPTERPPETLFGLKVLTSSAAFGPSDRKGSRVITDDSGTPVGEILASSIYVFHNATASDSQREQQIFRKILEQAVPLVEETVRERDEQQGDRLEGLKCLISERISQQIKRTEEAITRHYGYIEDLERDIRSEREQLMAQLNRVRSLELALEESNTRAEEELDRLLRLPGIREVRIDKSLRVFTEVLHCVDPCQGSTHEIGAFRIDIVPSRTMPVVQVLNQTRRVRGLWDAMNAPYVDNQGWIVVQNANLIDLHRYLAEGRFAALVEAVLKTLTTARSDEFGRCVRNWPEVAPAPEAHAAEEEVVIV